MPAKLKPPAVAPIAAPPKPVQGKTNPYVQAPPRIKPAAMRNYGKGQSTMSAAPTPAAFGAGIGSGNT